MIYADVDLPIRTPELAYALAVGEACREAMIWVGERYAIDEAGRSKLIRLVVKVAKTQMRSGHHITDRSDIETMALMAARYFVSLQSGS